MQLGWIDFSKSDRDKVLSVIQLLKAPGALDELGIGSIRDAFAEYFFPGISTIQTRAKYFLIVPYVLKEAGEGKYGFNPDQVIRKIDDRERDCGLKLKKAEDEKDKKGVFGAETLPDRWVVRRPSEIYWSGIKALGIFKEKELSIKEYLRLSLQLTEKNKEKTLGSRSGNSERNPQDDRDAGNFDYKSFWKLPTYTENWFEDLTIRLRPEEAVFLREQIEENLPGSLLAYIVKNKIQVYDYDGFEAISEAVKEDVSSELRSMMELANDFNELVYMARIRYNIILSDGTNRKANEEWRFYGEDPAQHGKADLEEIMKKLRIKNEGLYQFLAHLQKDFLDRDVEAADQLIKKREINLKGASRAKLLNHGEEWAESWVGGGRLDYRFLAARDIINDIYEGEKGGTNV